MRISALCGFIVIAVSFAATSALAEQVTASWYGKGYAGKRTASGERFDPSDLTAAHPFLPFGTRVEVRNPADGRSVVVRVNDRGPAGGKRAIDLSEAAARKIGLLAQGVGPVTLHPVEDWQ
jgi:rare lipoprotein A